MNILFVIILLTVGGLLPLWLIKRAGGRLLSYKISTLGTKQEFLAKAAAADTLVNFLRGKVSPGATLRITGNFREDKTGRGTLWNNFLCDLLNSGNNIKVKAYLEANVKHPGIEDLEKAGMEVVYVNKIGKDHYVTVDNPRQVWAEGTHAGYYAYNCVYTDAPFPEVWSNLEKYFQELEQEAKSEKRVA